ncbi:phage head completion protein [Aminipila sp.]|uniref:phage head completion protein n=1 Tax=Aminipila sp. TaxID=2060095 RepID=UPI0028A19C44|nr:hypothetical protein [Aminipila sp.]
MSINQEMRPLMLQKRKDGESPTGAVKYEWEDVKTIDVAVYKTNSTLNTQNVRYNESSHTGLTYEKEVEENLYRLVDGERVYDITLADTKNRLTSLLLKEIDTNV